VTPFQKRILSAVIAGPLTLWVIILGGFPFALLIAAGAAISLYEFYMMEKRGQNLARNLSFWAFYIAVCAFSFFTLRMGFGASGVFLVLALMLTVWASDIGAYFIGKKIGGVKLAPKISPNKTWAGLLGGMMASGLALMIFDAIGEDFSANLTVVFLTGVLMGAVGQAGDLLVSLLKRRVGVKDTGHIIPGHGGLLDRIDSLLLVTPVFLLACLLWLV
jgi:phosphatidate cytidylyltransferase